MICPAAHLPELFAESSAPRGKISDEAARLIAAILWQAVEDDMQEPPLENAATVATARG